MTDYETARAEHTAAWYEFEKVRKPFVDASLPREQRPSNEQFDEAKRIYDAALAKFDAAFAKAQRAG